MTVVRVKSESGTMKIISSAFIFFSCILITNVTQLLGATYYCNSKSACASTIVNNSDGITCYGLKSCTNARLTSYEFVGQSGSLSGYKSKVNIKYSASHSGFWLGARGYFGHAFANDSLGVYHDVAVTCYGEGSCLGAYYLGYGAKSYDCLGKMSCAHSLVALKTNNNTNNDILLQMRGGFSFYNGSLHTNGRNIDMRMEGGFSGYGASVYCMAGDKCNFTCYDNGCYNLHVYCIGNASCISDNCDSSVNTSYKSGVVCPNIYYVNGTNDDEIIEDSDVFGDVVLNDYNGNTAELAGLNMWTFIPESYSFYLSMIEDETNGRLNNDLCRLNMTRCDGYLKCPESIEVTNNGSICCRGTTSCSASGSSYLTADSSGNNSSYGIYDGNVFCDAFQSCLRHTITVSGNIYVGGTEAAVSTNSVLDTKNNIYCGGM